MNDKIINLKITEWFGYEKHDFIFNGHEAVVVLPKDKTKRNMKWYWRAEFFGEYDFVDKELLNRGYIVAHYWIPNMYGCPDAIKLMETFYSFFIEEYKVCEKFGFIGQSRGALYSLNFASKHPNLVSTAFLNAPVLDIKSWPRKKEAALWEECKKLYGLTEENYNNFKGSPVDNFDIFLKHNIAIYVCSADHDKSVRFDENAKLLIDAYTKNNKPIAYHVEKDSDLHGLYLDPNPICDFLCKVY